MKVCLLSCDITCSSSVQKFTGANDLRTQLLERTRFLKLAIEENLSEFYSGRRINIVGQVNAMLNSSLARNRADM